MAKNKKIDGFRMLVLKNGLIDFSSTMSFICLNCSKGQCAGECEKIKEIKKIEDIKIQENDELSKGDIIFDNSGRLMSVMNKLLNEKLQNQK